MNVNTSLCLLSLNSIRETFCRAVLCGWPFKNDKSVNSQSTHVPEVTIRISIFILSNKIDHLFPSRDNEMLLLISLNTHFKFRESMLNFLFVCIFSITIMCRMLFLKFLFYIFSVTRIYMYLEGNELQLRTLTCMQYMRRLANE